MGFLAPRSSLRQAKNFILNYSDMEQLVREATCNEPGEPQETLMREISRGAVHWILILRLQSGVLRPIFVSHRPGGCCLHRHLLYGCDGHS